MRTAAPVRASSPLSALSRDADRSRLNARSDPRYLVRYYRGARDPARTPYARPEDLPKPPVQLAQRDDTEDALMRADDEEHDTAARQLQLDRLQAEAEAEGEGKEQAKAAESLARQKSAEKKVNPRPLARGSGLAGTRLHTDGAVVAEAEGGEEAGDGGGDREGEGRGGGEAPLAAAAPPAARPALPRAAGQHRHALAAAGLLERAAGQGRPGGQGGRRGQGSGRGRRGCEACRRGRGGAGSRQGCGRRRGRGKAQR